MESINIIKGLICKHALTQMQLSPFKTNSKGIEMPMQFFKKIIAEIWLYHIGWNLGP